MRYTLSLTGNIILESKGLANAYFGRSKVIRERFEELPIQAHPSTRQIHHEQIASTRNTQRRRQAQAIRIRCCRMHHPVEVAVPNIFKEPLVIRVEGRDETDRFVWQGMPVLRDAKGLFALRFTRDGDLVERFFAPAATASTGLWRVPEGAPGDRWLIIWRADPESIPPKWLNTERGQSGMWWAATHEQLKQLTP